MAQHKVKGPLFWSPELQGVPKSAHKNLTPTEEDIVRHPLLMDSEKELLLKDLELRRKRDEPKPRSSDPET